MIALEIDFICSILDWDIIIQYKMNTVPEKDVIPSVDTFRRPVRKSFKIS